VSEFNEPIGSEAPNGVSRRTVTKAMAWAVPVIAVSTAVPAFAASQGLLTLLGTGCKLPGNSNGTYKGYAFALTVENTTLNPLTVLITAITLNGESLGQTGLVNLVPTPATLDPNPFTIAPGNAFSAALLTQNAANSSNGTLSITYTIDGGTPIVVTKTVSSAPPINGASCTAFTAAQKVKLAAVQGLPAIPLWAPSTAYALADTVRLLSGEILTATTAGISGTVAPTPPGAGNTVGDGTVVWTQVG
jgi:hypothetical protein